MIKKRQAVARLRKITEGGTEVNSVSALKTLLGTYDKSRINEPLQLVGLDNNGNIDNVVSQASVPVETLDGFASIHPDTVNIYKIQNYSSFKTYNVSVSAGGFTRVNNVITYTAPTTPGIITITVNGTVTTITVIQPTVTKPSITSPTNGNNTIGINAALVATTFESNHPNAVHVSSSWEVSRFSDFSVLFASSYNDTVNKLNYTVYGMSLSTQYYVRVKYKDFYGNESPWSDTITFTVRTNEIIEIDQLFALQKYNATPYGDCIALSPDKQTLVVVTPSDNNLVSSSLTGSIRIFKKKSDGYFILTQSILVALTLGSVGIDFYDTMIAWSGDGLRFAVGLPHATVGSYTYEGIVRVFKYSGSTWSQEALLNTATPYYNNYFGRGLAFNQDGSKLLVGAAGGAVNLGHVQTYLRTGSTWAYNSQITDNSQPVGSMFGYSLTATADLSRIFVGCPKGTISRGANFGCVYVYVLNNGTYVQEAILETPSLSTLKGFAAHISINDAGDIIAISQVYSVGVGSSTDVGYVYIFKRVGTTWTYVQQLSSGVGSSFYGARVKLSSSGKSLFVGECKYTYSYSGEGLLNIYEKTVDTYGSQKILRSPTPVVDGRFGKGFDFDETNGLMFVSSNKDSNPPIANLTNNYQGSIHVFKKGF